MSEDSDTVSTNTDTSTPVSCFCCKKASCKRLCCGFNSYWRLLILFISVAIYLFVGGALFTALEKPNETRSIKEAQVARNSAITDLEMQVASFVNLLVNATNLSREEAENLTRTVVSLSQRVSEANQTIPAEINPIWDFSSAVFFASTVVTTIGYGTIAPVTSGGQTFFIFYALIGIPLALIFLAQIGSIIDKWVERALSPVKRRWGATVSRAAGVLILVLVALIFFILIPAAIYDAIEEWDYRQSVYFTIVTLTTVGFGDFVPALSGVATTTPGIALYKLITAAWLWIGLAIVAALISESQNLIESVGKWCRTHRCCKLKNKMEIQPDENELTKVAAKKEENTQDEAEHTSSGIEGNGVGNTNGVGSNGTNA